MSLRGRFRFSLLVALAGILLSAVPSAARAGEKPLRPGTLGIRLFLETSVAKLWQGAFGWLAAGDGEIWGKAGLQIDPNGNEGQAAPPGNFAGGPGSGSAVGGFGGSSGLE